MTIYSFDGEDFKRIFTGAANLLGELEEEINALNVFPVPDGDTGTNMYMTLAAAVKEAGREEGNELGLVAEAAARGAFMGARGNSGVILSQILKGFSKAFKGKERGGASDIAEGFQKGAEEAYRAVTEPVEGTILTVARKTAEAAKLATRRSSDLLRVIISCYRQSVRTLEETPKMLPVLREAGVVDAGGRGYTAILEGILRSLKMVQEIELLQDFATRQKKKIMFGRAFQQDDIDEAINFTYCTELVVKGKNLPLETLRRELASYGNSLVVVGEGDAAKVHIHSNHPGLVMESCLNFGTLHDVKVDNMKEQHREKHFAAGTATQIAANASAEIAAGVPAGNSGEAFTGAPETVKKITGIVSVGIGEGIIEIMRNLGADVVIMGGQTMNPSTDDIARAVAGVPASGVIILPNNKNVVLTAQQAAAVSKKEVRVVPSESIPQGLAAMLAFNPDAGVDENERRMLKELSAVRTGEITTAVRDSSVNGLVIKKGDIIGVSGGKILAVGPNSRDVLFKLIPALGPKGDELVTLYYGSNISAIEAENIIAALEENFPGYEFELYEGGQPYYHFILSVE